MMSSQHPFPARMLSINVFTEIDVSFQNFNHMLIFVILTRHINTKLLKSCSESQELLKVAKIGKRYSKRQKLLKVAEHNLSEPKCCSWLTPVCVRSY